MQVSGKAEFLAMYQETGNIYELIVTMIHSMPLSTLVLVLLLVTMMAFYATSFDSIALIASCYSYRKLNSNEQPHKLIQLMWCILLILLPIAFIFSESSMSNLQSVSIISAFPIGIVMILIVVSFIKDAKEYTN